MVLHPRGLHVVLERRLQLLQLPLRLGVQVIAFRRIVVTGQSLDVVQARVGLDLLVL